MQLFDSEFFTSLIFMFMSCCFFISPLALPRGEVISLSGSDLDAESRTQLLLTLQSSNGGSRPIFFIRKIYALPFHTKSLEFSTNHFDGFASLGASRGHLSHTVR